MGQLRRCMMEVPLVLSSGQMPNCGVGTWVGGGVHTSCSGRVSHMERAQKAAGKPPVPRPGHDLKHTLMNSLMN